MVSRVVRRVEEWRLFPDLIEFGERGVTDGVGDSTFLVMWPCGRGESCNRSTLLLRSLILDSACEFESERVTICRP